MDRKIKKNEKNKKNQTDKLSLKECFAAPSYEQWRQEADRLLGETTDAAQRAALETPGFDWGPIFRQEDENGATDRESVTQAYPGLPPFTRSPSLSGHTNKPWTVMQDIPYPEPARFNEILCYGLDQGLSGLLLRFDRAGRFGLDPDQARVGDVGWNGLSISTVDDLSTALDGIQLDKYPLHLDCGASPLVGISFLVVLCKRANISLSKLTGCLATDPLGGLAVEAALPAEIGHIYDEMAESVKWSRELENFSTVSISTVPYQESGLTAPEQLGCLLATGLAYFKAMESRGITPEQIQKELSFSLAVGSNLMVEVAKLRACRMVWSRLMELSDIPATIGFPKMHLHSSTSSRTLYDQHVNLLRGTVEAFASIIGGCDSLTISPLDHASGQPDQFSLRLARNTQLILAEESHLGAVIDPAGGSYYIERLTDSIAEQAWNKFTEIETMGGMLHALQSGLINHWISETVAHRSERLVRRKDVIVGSSKYLDLSEPEPSSEHYELEKLHNWRKEQIADYKNDKARLLKPDDLREIAERWSSSRDRIIESLTGLAEKGGTLGELAKAVRGDNTAAVRIEPLAQFRPSEMFEHLRSMVEAYQRQQGDHPQIFLAVIGQGNGLQPQIEFARDYFAVAGYRTKFEKVYATADEAIHAIEQSQPALVLLIASDKDYPDLVPAMCELIKEKSPATVIALAGYPEKHIDSFTKAGVSEFIYDGADIQAGLLRLSHQIGVSS